MYNTYKYNDITPDLRNCCARFAAKRERARIARKVWGWCKLMAAVVALALGAYMMLFASYIAGLWG